MTDIILITGFFGAGKTTFLNRLIDYYTSKQMRIGIILNEFGEINIDKTLIWTTDEYQLIEINNGSIFCSCLQSVFVDGLKHYARNPVDVLLIETSGFADPSGMCSIIEAINKNTGNVFHYLHSICIVDCFHFLTLIESVAVMEKQIGGCNIVVMNKTDLVDDRETEAVSGRIRKIDSSAMIYPAVNADIELDILNLEDKFPAAQKRTALCLNTPSYRPDTFYLTGDNRLRLSQFTDLMNNVKGKAYRIKGYWNLAEGLYFFESINGIVNLRKVIGRKQHKNGIVFVYQHDHDISSALMGFKKTYLTT
ncbi:MAG: GTP-binding protein [Deltaproteobacteria bacterium]|nr:GTP-binding protein [Deltaproteobacteria bacterium]